MTNRKFSSKHIFITMVLVMALFTAIPQKVAAAPASVQQDAYSIGSISKMYTTAAVMKLYEEGLLDIDEPVTTYLPEFSMADERYQMITVRMLLNHTSGLMGTTNHNAFTFGISDTRYHDHILEELKTQKLKADPGAYGVYCNDGFTLAELVIESVSGMSYSEYLDQNFFKPLGINNTFTSVYNFQEERIAPSYVDNSVLPYVNCHLIGSGGIYSTASDVAQFGQLFTKQGASILSAETLAMMAESSSSKDSICYTQGDKQIDYGLGWDCVNTYPYSAYGLQALTKGGSVVLQNSALVVLPDENISAAMIVSGGSGDDATYALQELILEVLVEEGIIEEKKDLSVQTGITPDTQPLPQEMKKYAGYYLSSQIIRVTYTEQDTLLIENTEDKYDLAQEYAYIGDGKFAPLEGCYLNHYGELTYNKDGNKGSGILYFRTENNGETYLFGESHETIYDLGENASSMAFAQKIEEITPEAEELGQADELSEEVLSTWEKRDGQKYFAVNSVYNSWDYFKDGIIELECSEDIPGYIHTKNKTDTAQIMDESYAVNPVDLPIMVGRDLTSYEFTATNDGEMLKYSTTSYISENQVLPFSELPQELTMNKSEDARWYKIDAEFANRPVQISVPEQGAYYLFDSEDECVATSITLEDGATILLPEGGYLLLAGEAGEQFTITLVAA